MAMNKYIYLDPINWSSPNMNNRIETEIMKLK